MKKKSDVKIQKTDTKYYMKVLSNSVFIVSHPISKKNRKKNEKSEQPLGGMELQEK